MDLAQVAKEVAVVADKAATGAGRLLDSIVRARPGLAIASKARGIASANDIMLDALEKTCRRCVKLGFDDETTDAMCTRLVNEFSKSENLGASLSFSSACAGESVDVSSIDHSWFIRWADGASEQFDDEMRRIWGKVLDGELENPGSYSKRTLSILSDMSKDEAESFRKICSYTIMDVKPFVVFLNDDGGGANDRNIDYEEIVSLEALGLIDSSSLNFVRFDPGESKDVMVGGRTMRITSGHTSQAQISFTPIMTRYGKELSRLCSSELGTGQNIIGILTKLLSAQGFMLTEAS